MQALSQPAQHSDGLDHGDGDPVVGPDAPVQQADIMPCDVLPEVGRGGRGRQRCVYGKRPIIRPESQMMRGLVNVDGSRHRVPRGYHQTGLGTADASVTQDILERILQRIGIILVAVEPADAAQLSTQEIAQHIPVLAEDLRPPVLVKSEYLRGRMPQRQGDANNPSRPRCRQSRRNTIRSAHRGAVPVPPGRRPGRCPGCRPRQYTGSGASFAPTLRLLSYHQRLLMSAPAGSALVFRDCPNDPRQDRSRQRSLPIRPCPFERADRAPSGFGHFCAPRTRLDCRGIIAPSPVFHHISTCRHASGAASMKVRFFIFQWIILTLYVR